MKMGRFTIVHELMEDAHFDAEEMWPIIRDRGPALGRDHKRTHCFLSARQLVEMATDKQGRPHASERLVAYARSMAALEMAERLKTPATERLVYVTSEIPVASVRDAEAVDDPVILAVLQNTGLALPKPPPGAEASWMHDAYVGVPEVPLRYTGLPTGLPGMLVRSAIRDDGKDHYSVTWPGVQYLRIGSSMRVMVTTDLPDTLRDRLPGQPLRTLVEVPGLTEAVITDVDDIGMEQERGCIDVGVTIARSQIQKHGRPS